jgi:hypothetical protein
MKNFNNLLERFKANQNESCKCACGELMRKKDFNHHSFFCEKGTQVSIGEFEVIFLESIEQQTKQTS